MKFYFVIPTINGEIYGEPFIAFSLNFDFKEEATIYEINFELNYISVKEVDY